VSIFLTLFSLNILYEMYVIFLLLLLFWFCCCCCVVVLWLLCGCCVVVVWLLCSCCVVVGVDFYIAVFLLYTSQRCREIQKALKVLILLLYNYRWSIQSFKIFFSRKNETKIVSIYFPFFFDLLLQNNWCKIF